MIRKSLGPTLVALLLLASGCGKNAPVPGSTAPPTSSSSGGGPSSSGGSSTPTGAGSNPGTTGTAPAASGGQSTGPANQPQQCNKVNAGPLKKGDNAKVCAVSVKLKDVAVITGSAGLPPGYAYVVVDLDVKNDGTAEYTINVTDHFKLTAPDGKNRQFNVQATAQRNPRLQGAIKQGEAQSGWLGYLVKLDPGTFTFAFTHPDYGSATWEVPIQSAGG
jgi:hypothetical protein